MNALARAFETRRCTMCKTTKPAEAFSSTSLRCRDCNRAYQKDRNRKLRAGTWKPHGVMQVTPPKLAHTGAASTSAQAEASLRYALEAFMVEFGFTALKVTYTRLEGELSKKHRLDLAREGWIA